MQMTNRFKLGLLALAVLAIAAVFVLTGDDTPDDRGGDLTADDLDAEERRGGPELTATGRERSPDGGSSSRGDPARTPGLPPGLREPSGIDLSKPDVRKSELERLLRAEEIDWRKVGKLLSIMTEPVSEDVRAIMLQELKTGRRNMVMFAFAEVRDPNFVEDLLEVMDNEELARGARVAALQALWQMPGANNDTVALAFESRLAGDLGKDRELLFGLAKRGGVEAARALVEYVGRSSQPSAIPPYILQTLDLTKNPEAASVVVDAMKGAEKPEVLSALVGMAGKPGNSAFTAALIDLDTDRQPPAVRARLLGSLAKIGDERATDYILERAAEPGEFGDKARDALGGMYAAQPGARSKLTKALETAGLNPKPTDMKESLLHALGALRHKPAMPGIARYLDDPEERVRRASIRAMGGLGADARPHVNRMRGHFESGDHATKVRVAVAFGEIGGDAAIGAMESWLKGKGLTPTLERTLRTALRAAKDAREREIKRGR